jgi:hypothetical protein
VRVLISRAVRPALGVDDLAAPLVAADEPGTEEKVQRRMAASKPQRDANGEQADERAQRQQDDDGDQELTECVPEPRDGHDSHGEGAYDEEAALAA